MEVKVFKVAVAATVPVTAELVVSRLCGDGILADVYAVDEVITLTSDGITLQAEMESSVAPDGAMEDGSAADLDGAMEDETEEDPEEDLEVDPEEELEEVLDEVTGDQKAYTLLYGRKMNFSTLLERMDHLGITAASVCRLAKIPSSDWSLSKKKGKLFPYMVQRLKENLDLTIVEEA